ncbi:LOW QUALITY PROTEIN: hypothetical protein PHMEG_00011338 [Phytophthora megakarya]|uniref:ZSWIM1/3 RNaseH-like domain-containing protein n=1 Tax=Phytophthora megakarya TaxID=4795 RepID=A0A225WCV9_9STRA|nr:LOW QUALITY PROTEIN: hypothetical protein PHMEG_00011338 [Phytophthora megakarya]
MGSSAPKIQVSWEQYAKPFVCTNHGKYKSRGNKQTTPTRIAKINACVKLVEAVTSMFLVKITKWNLERKHRLTGYAFRQHPSKRIVMNDATMHIVDKLRKAGSKKMNILKFITDNSESNSMTQDARNLHGNRPSKIEKRLKKWMMDFEDQPGDIGRICTDDGNENVILATCIKLQTKYMGSLFDQFPEVMLLDVTHGTNRSKYKDFSFMAHDTFGKGQFVQHALLQNERWPTLLTQTFKSNNPAWSIEFVLIDKEFTELSVLKQVYPNDTILLCQFHVLTYLGEDIASAEYRFSSWQKDYRSRVCYNRETPIYSERSQNQGQLPRTLVRKQDPEYSETKYQHKQPSWKRLKEWVDSFISDDACIASTMYYQSVQEKRFFGEVYKTVNAQHAAYDGKMTLVTNVVSGHAGDIIYEPYLYAITWESYEFYEGYPGVYFAKVPVKMTISLTILTQRITKIVIPTQLLYRRWLLSTVRSANEYDNAIIDRSIEAPIRIVRSETRSNRKYRETSQIATEIVDTMADLRMVQYREAV